MANKKQIILTKELEAELYKASALIQKAHEILSVRGLSKHLPISRSAIGIKTQKARKELNRE